jgi:hypothetical protein
MVVSGVRLVKAFGNRMLIVAARILQKVEGRVGLVFLLGCFWGAEGETKLRKFEHPVFEDDF